MDQQRVERGNFSLSFSQKFGSILVHISSSINPMRLVQVSLKKSSTPLQCEHKCDLSIQHFNIKLVGMSVELNMDCRDSCPSNPYCRAFLFKGLLKGYHAFGFKPIIFKFSIVTNVWMLFLQFSIQSILNIGTQSPARLENGSFKLGKTAITVNFAG